MTFSFRVPIQKIINCCRLIHSTIVFAESLFESLSDILHFTIFYISEPVSEGLPTYSVLDIELSITDALFGCKVLSSTASD